MTHYQLHLKCKKIYILKKEVYCVSEKTEVYILTNANYLNYYQHILQ